MPGKNDTLQSRRTFLKKSPGIVAALGAPYIVPPSVLGKQAPSNRITMGCIGVGGMGTNDMRAFMSESDVQIVAVCDPVKSSNEYEHWYQHGWQGNYFGREAARLIVDDHYAKNKRSGRFSGCTAYTDFRGLLNRDDIDAITIVTPDQWHAVMSIMAARKGKHIYCEKPMTLTISEGRQVIQAVRKYGVIFQTGCQRRSEGRVRHACELVRNGRIGDLKTIKVVLGTNNKIGPVTWQPMPIPPGFDYDMWLGPAPRVPYHKDRCLYKFRFISDYSGGQTTNLGAHAFDIAQWGNGTDQTGPVEIEDLGSKFPQDGLFDTVTFINFRARYANGVEMTCKTGPVSIDTRFEGTEGWISVGANDVQAFPQALLTSRIKPDEIHLYDSHNHHRNFIDCIKSGRDPSAPVEIGHYSVSLCHLGNIAMTLKGKLSWDPQKEKFLNHAEANRMLSKPLRAPWTL